MNDSLKKDTTNGVVWSAIERFSAQGVQFLIGLILARLLTPVEFGIIGMLAIFISVSNVFVDSGFSSALIQNQQRTETDFSTAFYFNLGIGLVCYAILFLISPIVADFFNTPILNPILRVLAFIVFINSLIVVQIAKLTIKIDFKTQAKSSFIATVISGIVGVSCAYMGLSVWALVVQQLSFAAINAILLWWFSKWIPSRVFSVDSFKKMFSYGGNILLSGIVHTLYMNLSTIAIGKYYTARALGYYTRGRQFPDLICTNLTSIIQRVTFPILSKIQDDTERLANIYRKYIKITSLGIFFLMVLLASLAKPMIIFLITDKWFDAIIFVQIMCYALMFDHLNKINLNLLYVKGKTNLVLRLEIIKKILGFIILLISIPIGVLAICIANVINCQIAIIVNTYYSGKYINLGYWKQFKDYLPYLLIAHIACFPAWLLSTLVDIPILVLVVGPIISTVIYVICLEMIKDRIYIEDIKPIIKKTFSYVSTKLIH